MVIRVVDGGGHGFRRADARGKNLKNFQIDGSIASVKKVVEFVCEDLPAGTVGIAFALAGVIEDNDLVVESPNAKWLNGVRLASEVKKELKERGKGKIDVAVFNDMEAAVTGMAYLLDEKVRARCGDYFLGITWSSGIGMRLWTRGRLLSAAEGGHMVIDPSPSAPVCGCGKRGHAEAIVSGGAVKRLVIKEAKARRIKLPRPKDVDPCEVLIDAWKDDKRWARGLKRSVARWMGLFLANIQSLAHVPLIVWKGTFALNAMKHVESDIRKEMKKHMIAPSWADKKELAFEISVGANPRSAYVRGVNPKFDKKRDANLDALLGAAMCFRDFVKAKRKAKGKSARR